MPLTMAPLILENVPFPRECLVPEDEELAADLGKCGGGDVQRAVQCGRTEGVDRPGVGAAHADVEGAVGVWV